MTPADSRSTIVSIFCDRVARSPDTTALSIKRNGRYVDITWGQVAEDVQRMVVGMRRAGLAAGDRVLQVSENRHEWIIADLAIQLAGAVHVPVHASLTGRQIAEQLLHSGARLVLLSGPEQANKLVSLSGELPADVRYFVYEPCDDLRIGTGMVQPISALQPESSASEWDAIVGQALASVQPDSLATILYTSGTTGEPKGVMLSQGNLASNTLATLEAFGDRPDDMRLNFLPLSHIFARTCDLYTWIANGSRLALAESRETVLADCAAVRPTVLNGVPYFYDRVYRHLCEQQLADQAGSLRRLLGGEIRLCCSGGAALPDHLFDFFTAQDVPLLQGYGLTETSPVISLCSPEAVKRGSAGKVIPGVEVRLADDGEILTRGPHVMLGYYRDRDATREIVNSDGWLHTGDLGRIDEDGFLYITGRKKEILVTSGGKNVAPVYLESLLTEDPLIVQAMVVGDGRNYLAAIIVPHPDNLRDEIIRQAIPVWSKEEALAHPQVRALYEECIRHRLSGVSHYEQVRRFTLLPRGFTIESGELTPKLTLRRPVIEANLAREIEAIYAHPEG